MVILKKSGTLELDMRHWKSGGGGYIKEESFTSEGWGF